MVPWGTPQEILPRAENLTINQHIAFYLKSDSLSNLALNRVFHNVRVFQKEWNDLPCERLSKGQGKNTLVKGIRCCSIQRGTTNTPQSHGRALPALQLGRCTVSGPRHVPQHVHHFLSNVSHLPAVNYRV